jgi:hypothetical protein
MRTRKLQNRRWLTPRKKIIFEYFAGLRKVKDPLDGSLERLILIVDLPVKRNILD